MTTIQTTLEKCRQRTSASLAGVSFGAALVAITTISCSGQIEEQLFPERPNIVLVTIDALRRDHLGLYGYGKPTSPFMDRLAAEGIVFDQAFSQASQTSVSTSTLFTSRFFPYEGGARGDGHQFYSIAQGNLTVAEVFLQSGYETFGMFTNPHHYPDSGFWQGFAETRYIKPNDTGQYVPQPYGSAPEVVDKFVQWMEARGPESEEPLFAYIHFMDVHNPYEPPEDLEQEFVTVRGRRGLYCNGKPEGEGIPTADDLEFMRARYDAGIREVDREIERLVAAIRGRELWRNTVLVVTSDHGDEFMEHGGLGHGVTMEKEMIWIPLFIHSEFAANRGLGRRVSGLVRHLDLAPTLLDIAGIEIPDEFQGRSLLPSLSKPSSAGTRPSQHSFAWFGPHRSVTTKEWHFVWNRETQEHRLYDNGADPRGLEDVAAGHPEVVESFLGMVEDYREEHERAWKISRTLQQAGDESSTEEMDPEIIEQLEALGYLG